MTASASGTFTPALNTEIDATIGYATEGVPVPLIE
jgi:hypothetical protein